MPKGGVYPRGFYVGTLERLTNFVPWLLILGFGAIGFLSLPWGLGFGPAAIVFYALLLGLLTALLTLSLPHDLSWIPAGRHWIFGIILAGCVLRITMVLVVPPVQLSDSDSYVNLARSLLAGEGYQQLRGEHLVLAWRPPGFPLLLLPFIWVTGDAWWAPALLNVACYMLSAFVIRDLCLRIADERCGTFAVALFTIWPSGLLLTGIAATEGPSLLLLLLVGWAMVVARDDPRLRWPVIAGFAIGLGALVRPSLLPLPALLLWLAVIRSADRPRSFRNAMLASVVAVACISPWTMRNFLVLGTPVLISTNGGDVLYRANNPLASGGFTPQGEIGLEHLLPDEVAWDRASKRAAMEWILDNPATFARLAARKLAISFAEDTTGAYWALSRAHNVTGLPYRIAVVVSNTWWVGVWMLALAALVRHREWFLSDINAGLLMWLLVLLPTVHAVFEAQPRYHMPIVGILVSISSLVAVRAGSLRSTST